MKEMNNGGIYAKMIRSDGDGVETRTPEIWTEYMSSPLLRMPAKEREEREKTGEFPDGTSETVMDLVRHTSHLERFRAIVLREWIPEEEIRRRKQEAERQSQS